LRYVAEDAPSGYGDAADRLVRALRDAGLRIEYRGWASELDSEIPGLHRHSRDPFPSERASRHAPTIVHLIPERYPQVRAAMPQGPLIAHTVWETDQIPHHWPELLRGVERVIVPTEWNRAVFGASGAVPPVVVVPHVACEPVPGDGGEPLHLPDDVVVFYTIARWDQRKAPAAVVQAFLEAFTADDPVALVVKTSQRAQFPPPSGWSEASPLLGTTLLEIARITRLYPRPPLIRVEVDDWTPERVAGLHQRGDCYVSLSHGEGWGLGAFDAAAYGNPVVMTNWGGQLAFLDPDFAFLVEYDLEPARHFLPRSYGPDQRWAVPRLEHAVAVLREIAADLAAACRRAAPLRETVLHDFAGPRVVTAFLAAVPEVTLANGGVFPSGAVASVRTRCDPTATLATSVNKPATPVRRGSSGPDELLLIGLTAGPWQSAFDNWVEMAERYGYRYELVGRGFEPYVPHFTKWQLLLDYFDDLPRRRLVFYVDASDGFVCDDAAQTLLRYRSYKAPLVLGAEDDPHRSHSFDVPARRWRWANAGSYVGEAGVVADALRGGYGLVDWEKLGRVCDQAAMIRYLLLPENRHVATVDYRRTIVENIMASPHREELAQHRVMLEHGAAHMCTSSVHFFGGNGRGYNSFAELYELAPQELAKSGWFRVSAPLSARE
jgi:hypothetical protein